MQDTVTTQKGSPQKKSEQHLHGPGGGGGDGGGSILLQGAAQPPGVKHELQQPLSSVVLFGLANPTRQMGAVFL